MVHLFKCFYNLGRCAILIQHWSKYVNQRDISKHQFHCEQVHFYFVFPSKLVHNVCNLLAPPNV